MARKPRTARRIDPPSRFARVLDNIIRHKLKWIIGAVLTLGPAGIVAAYAFVEPGLPAFHYWVRDFTSPFLKVQADHETYINYLKLRDARQALKDAKEDLAKNPNSSSAQQAVAHYDAAVQEYEKDLKKTRPE
jgi:hypothetical protein